MSRRRQAVRRVVPPDPVYGDVVVTRFTNCLMGGGKRYVAERILYGAFDKLAASGADGLALFHQALENVRPEVEVRSRRVGGATYQVPMDVRPERASTLAMRWLILAARGRNESSMVDRLAAEIREASERRGSAIKRREDTHKMAEANRAFAHYRW
ncbi:MAG: 30S ribosomal protein S7 [Alphaproteobacteria bacterium]